MNDALNDPSDDSAGRLAVSPWIAGPAGAVVAALLLYSLPADIPLGQGALALAIMAVGLVPAWLWTRGRHPGRFPLLALCGLFYVICFGLPVFLYGICYPVGIQPYIWAVMVPDRGALTQELAQLLVLAGLTVFIGCFYLTRRRWRRWLPAFAVTGGAASPGNALLTRLRVLLWLLLAGYVASLYSGWVRSLPSIDQFLQPGGLVAISGLFVLSYRGKMPKAEALAFWLIAIPVIVAKLIVGGLLTPVFLIALLLFLHLLRYRPRLAISLPIIGAVMLIMTYWPMTQYRLAQQANPEMRNYSIVDKGRWIAQSIVDTAKDPALLHFTVRNLVRRISLIMVFSLAAQKTPDEIPYWDGTTYKPLMSSMVPRIFWPDKPEERAGKAFGDRYKLIPPSNPSSINIPWLTELFINFGAAGVVLGMAVFGLLFSAVDHIFNNRRLSEIEGAIGVALIFRFVYPESNFSVMAGSFPLQILCMWIYFRVGLTMLKTALPEHPTTT